MLSAACKLLDGLSDNLSWKVKTEHPATIYEKGGGGIYNPDFLRTGQWGHSSLLQNINISPALSSKNLGATTGGEHYWYCNARIVMRQRVPWPLLTSVCKVISCNGGKETAACSG